MISMEKSNEEFFIIEHATDRAKSIIYAPLRSYLAKVPFEVGYILASREPSNLKDSFFGLLATKPKVEMSEVLTNLHHATPELSLAITDNCNLRCLYCHASAGDPHKRKTMSKRVIRAILDAYFSFISSQSTVSINFNGGGEPTFAFAELNFAIEYAQDLAASLGKRVTFAMATNGCYGDRIRRYVVEHFRSVSLSLDGPAFIHDRHRPTTSGEGSFSHVFGTAKFFVEHKFPFAFRATISAFSLQHIYSIIDFIAAEFSNKSIGLEHLNPFGRAERNIDPEIAPPDKQEFANAITGLLDYARARGVLIMNSASTEYNLLRPVFCSNVGIPNWTVSTDGNIVACGRDRSPEEFTFGRFDEHTGKVTLNQEKITKLRSLNVLEYPECQNCFCKYHCAGDCPDRRLADKSDCDYIRQIARQVLTNIVDGREQPRVGVTDTGSRN